ncbi:adenylosuccinate lyase [Cavenderia fasciculata]|uniref:Adenylosuccinate lyase n=1 Tax=Cavenderia fasciculata TaxID=261658 RepID=F4Q308_CACFS|nr:adenylosuccinate lyase [Cavenderia fasciculata]EGG17572.1 adenylosuccinate lyase [Cavenderia fasciculata]|eukprot:XP_004356056.1 adenylosuccinate lyase [Cavenderia fasciculata]
MELNQLTAISPIDGRYWDKCNSLSEVYVEIEYFIKLSTIAEVKPLQHLSQPETHEKLRNIYKNFSFEDAQAIKKIEKTTNHDIKAVEYFIKDKMVAILGAQEVTDLQKEFVHFGLTSQDVNNTAIPLSLVEAVDRTYMPLLNKHVVDPLLEMARSLRSVPLLARTHGQPATPTTLGKELMVFAERLSNQIQLLRLVPHSAKFGGATGNLNAHTVAYPSVQWADFADSFVQHLNPRLKRARFTTQIEHYDCLAALLDAMKRINTILIDMCRDIWQYVSMEYFGQRVIAGEVGSSTMPHKVNPIDFENAEGNLGIANALYEHLAAKLPISRLQRDLTDSTVLRNLGVPMAHSLLSFASIARGLSKLVVNEATIKQDLDANWAVIGEAIQTVLRREGYPKPYEALKELTRVSGGKKISHQDLIVFIDTLNVNDQVKDELKQITPFNYIGHIPEF